MTLTLEGVYTLAGNNVPHFNSGVGVATDKDVALQLHPACERLMAHQGADTSTSLRIPHTNARVQRPTYNVYPIKLYTKQRMFGENENNDT